MATRELAASPSPAEAIAVASANQNYSRPLAIVTTLFFMWGFLTCLNDILVPHLKSIFDLSYTRVMLVQFAFFSAYFLFSIPWSKVVNRIGYQRTMVVGLLTMALGAFLFVPAACAAHVSRAGSSLGEDAIHGDLRCAGVAGHCDQHLQIAKDRTRGASPGS